MPKLCPTAILPMNAPEPVLTVAETAAALKVSTRTVRRLIKAKKLAVVRVGGSVRVRAKPLAALTRGE
jgi:excisionase family DNA binding protein